MRMAEGYKRGWSGMPPGRKPLPWLAYDPKMVEICSSTRKALATSNLSRSVLGYDGAADWSNSRFLEILAPAEKFPRTIFLKAQKGEGRLIMKMLE